MKSLQIHHAIPHALNLDLVRLKYQFVLRYPQNSSSYRDLSGLQILTKISFTEPV